jgi:maleylpyruvate isomerase
MAGRTDQTTDSELAARLLVARRGQAYFSRKLQELRDDQFRLPSGLPDWSRAHLIAHVGLNARALTRLTEWARTGIETPMYESPTQRAEEIDFAATLPVQALRNLSDHAAVHLNVEWRDLTDEEWDHPIRTALGRIVPVSETVWMRTREVWVHAVDLDNGARFADFPDVVVDGLLTDIARAWQKPTDDPGPSFLLEFSDREAPLAIPTGNPTVVSLTGTASALACWASGRGSSGVTNVSEGTVSVAPRWL